MRLFEAIIDANHRALDGDKTAGLHVADYADELPVVAMTCIDPRLNRLLPGVMGLPAEGFIWLRNAGNIIFGPLSSMTRSLSLACAVKGGREIAIIGHTDCQVCRTTIPELVEKYRAIGIERNQLPDNLAEYFGVFSSEKQNVIQSVEIVRGSPLISASMPVQGLMIDVTTGRLEWVVNGYEVMERRVVPAPGIKMPEIGRVSANLAENIGNISSEIKHAETKIGEIATEVKRVSEAIIEPRVAPKPSSPPPIPKPANNPRPIPVPPPIRMHPKG